MTPYGSYVYAARFSASLTGGGVPVIQPIMVLELEFNSNAIDWPLLRKQKDQLLRLDAHLQDHPDKAQIIELVDGVVGLLDFIQDAASSQLGEDVVFCEYATVIDKNGDRCLHPALPERERVVVHLVGVDGPELTFFAWVRPGEKDQLSRDLSKVLGELEAASNGWLPEDFLPALGVLGYPCSPTASLTLDYTEGAGEAVVKHA
jgi:hypothetical protein